MSSQSKTPNINLIMNVFKSMSENTAIRSKYQQAYATNGLGVWLVFANSPTELAQLDASKAVYIPMRSLDMFFADQEIMKQSINPSTEMLLAIVCVSPEEKRTRHFCTKATIDMKVALPQKAYSSAKGGPTLLKKK